MSSHKATVHPTDYVSARGVERGFRDMSEYYQAKRRQACEICKVGGDQEALLQFGDYVWLCTLCNSHRKDKAWTFTSAWDWRRKEKLRRQRCSFCGSPPVLVDINGDEHPNPFHKYGGRQECQYCEYDRTVAEPRHRLLMARSKRYPVKADWIDLSSGKRKK